MAFDLTQHGLNVRQDAGVTALVGPLRTLVSILGTLFLVRIILARGGLEVVGLWSLLNVVMTFVSLMEVGFSQLLARDIHASDDQAASLEHALDKRAVEQVYGILLCGVVIPAVVLLAWLIPPVPYDRLRFLAVLVIMAWATVTLLQGKLEAAVLAAYQDNARVQWANLVGAVTFLAVAIPGAWLDAPLEGIALGTLASALLVLWICRRRVAWRGLGTMDRRSPGRESLRRVVRLAKTGAHFYSMSIGYLLREPFFRIATASLLGVKALGAYSISFRAGLAARELVAGGAQVLYPAFASLHRAGNRKDADSLQAAAMIFLVTLGSIALGSLYGFAEPIFRLFLGTVPEGVVPAARILVIWNLITLFNIPFDYLLQATGHERVSAVALWIHTLAILLIWPLNRALGGSLNGFLVYWTGTSLLTQFILFYYVHKKLNGFWPVVAARPARLVLLLALLYWGIVVAWVPRVQAPAGSWAQAIGLAQVLLPASLIFVGLAFAASHRIFLPFWRKA